MNTNNNAIDLEAPKVLSEADILEEIERRKELKQILELAFDVERICGDLDITEAQYNLYFSEFKEVFQELPEKLERQIQVLVEMAESEIQEVLNSPVVSVQADTAKEVEARVPQVENIGDISTRAAQVFTGSDRRVPDPAAKVKRRAARHAAKRPSLERRRMQDQLTSLKTALRESHEKGNATYEKIRLLGRRVSEKVLITKLQKRKIDRDVLRVIREHLFGIPAIFKINVSNVIINEMESFTIDQIEEMIKKTSTILNSIKDEPIDEVEKDKYLIDLFEIALSELQLALATARRSNELLQELFKHGERHTELEQKIAELEVKLASK
jgi:hypothetical protein